MIACFDWFYVSLFVLFGKGLMMMGFFLMFSCFLGLLVFQYCSTNLFSSSTVSMLSLAEAG
jgi:hypothetical protein